MPFQKSLTLNRRSFNKISPLSGNSIVFQFSSLYLTCFFLYFAVIVLFYRRIIAKLSFSSIFIYVDLNSPFSSNIKTPFWTTRLGKQIYRRNIKKSLRINNARLKNWTITNLPKWFAVNKSTPNWIISYANGVCFFYAAFYESTFLSPLRELVNFFLFSLWPDISLALRKIEENLKILHLIRHIVSALFGCEHVCENQN